MAIDFTSATWRALEQHALARIAVLRERNDQPSLDATKTAELRGRIAAWKELLALAKQQPAPAQQADTGY